ncbi:uncharacterized protein LOC116766386 [Danaus plexippus]|uniref:uncharacterized protein LOC116766386 n=1 Tax=Danaus plexippus TaxID=13037 RepID=UPI002AB2028E|nr:uncharacterized protein LOC116766386 [Danaus plexippus]
MKTEYLSDDLFDEGHLKLFAPFRFCQLIFGSCRIDARDRFVTAPTWGQKAYTVIILILVAVLQLYIICHYVSQLYDYPIVYHINVLFTALNSILYALNIIHLRFTNNERNVKFYIKTQKIDRKLKISDNNPCIIFLYNVNLCSVVFVIVTSLIVFFVVYIYNTELFVSFSGLFFCQLTSLIELMFCSNIIIYFYMRFRFINAIIRNHLKGLPYKKGRNTKFFIPTRSNMRYLVASLHDFSTSQIDEYLKDIFDAHLQFQELYRWQVLLFCFKFVSMAILAFEYLLLLKKHNIIKWIDFMLLTLLTAVDLFMIIVICIRCEAFSSEIKDIKRLCTTILSLHYEGPLRDKARKMIKLIDEKPHHISIYDMWNMDASTMLNMINVVTTLLVTLLQFALL